MKDAELLEELERRVDAVAFVPFSAEEGVLVKSLSFASRPLTRETYRDAWKSFLEEIGLEVLGWPVHFGVAVWCWEHEMRLHAAAVFEHIHRDVRRGYDQIGEVAGYQADYLPGMLQPTQSFLTAREPANYLVALRNYMRMVTSPFLNTQTDCSQSLEQ